MTDMKDFYDQGVYQAEKYGDDSKLIETLRSDAPLYRTIREYLADRLEGKIQRAPGPKAAKNEHIYGDPDSVSVSGRRELVRTTYEAEKAALRERGDVASVDLENVAINNTAAKLGMKQGWVSHLLYARSKRPGPARKLESVEEIAKQPLWRKKP